MPGRSVRDAAAIRLEMRGSREGSKTRHEYERRSV
jgi:hypothetical protein